MVVVMVSRSGRTNWANFEKQGSFILADLRLHQRIDTSFHSRKVPVIGRFGHEHNRCEPRNHSPCQTLQGTEGHSSNCTEGLGLLLSICGQESLFALKQSRMRIVEGAHQGMRERMRKILDVKLAERRDQGLSAPYRILRETIGFKLVLA
jgi:hypothetical protein